MADNWEIFVRWHRDEVVGIVLHTPIYNLIAKNFPIQFITKLISTALSSADHTTVISAAAIIQDVAETNDFPQELNSPTTTVETIEFLRRNALYFMLNELAIVELMECGRVLASKLLRSSLEANGEWNDFLLLARRSFFLSEYALIRRWILDVICDQPHELARQFLMLLEPSISENYSLFSTRMTSLLNEGNDHRPYRILANVCGLLSDEKWSLLMEAAIWPSFFDDVHSSSSRVSAASSLRFCIDNGPDFYYSLFTICKLQAIIIVLHRSSEPLERDAGVDLFEAFARRMSNVPIPRH